jgi:hypothetical protein
MCPPPHHDILKELASRSSTSYTGFAALYTTSPLLSENPEGAQSNNDAEYEIKYQLEIQSPF